MNPNSILLAIFFTLSTFLAHTQEHESILIAPDNWQGEIIAFPISFAPTIDFVGFEDLRFAPGWSNKNSPEFWTYMFVWYVERDSALTESKLTGYFKSYYDGLMGVKLNNQADSTKSKQLDETRCTLIKTPEGIRGKMRVYDAFFTKEYMTLNIKVKQSVCPKTNKQIILCEISPKAFDDAVWGIFEAVKLKVDCD